MTHQPPDLEDLINRRQGKFGKKESRLTPAEAVRAALAFSLIACAIVGGAGLWLINQKIEQVLEVTTKATAVMEKLPESIASAQKLLDRTDESVKRGITELKTAVPEVSKGLSDTFRSRFKREETPAQP